MSEKPDIVEDWQSRLVKNQEQLVAGNRQTRWKQRMNVRLFRFLVDNYGDGQWRPEELPTQQSDNPTGKMIAPDPPPAESQSGAPAKSAELIHETLDAVATANDPHPPKGAMIHGLGNADWITVASESGHISPRRAIRLLRRHGILARAVWQSDDVLIQVPLGASDTALTLIRENRSALHVTQRPLYRTNPIAFGADILVEIAKGFAAVALIYLLITMCFDYLDFGTPRAFFGIVFFGVLEFVLILSMRSVRFWFR
jgi:hypothetical protein